MHISFKWPLAFVYYNAWESSYKSKTFNFSGGVENWAFFMEIEASSQKIETFSRENRFFSEENLYFQINWRLIDSSVLFH